MSETTEVKENRLDTYFRPLIKHLKTRTGVGEATLIMVREEDITGTELSVWDDFCSLCDNVINALENAHNKQMEMSKVQSSLNELLAEIRKMAKRVQRGNQDSASPDGRRNFYNWLLSPIGALLNNVEYVRIQLESGKRNEINFDEIIEELRGLLDRRQLP